MCSIFQIIFLLRDNFMLPLHMERSLRSHAANVTNSNWAIVFGQGVKKGKQQHPHRGLADVLL
jgi:hypothetical protein